MSISSSPFSKGFFENERPPPQQVTKRLARGKTQRRGSAGINDQALGHVLGGAAPGFRALGPPESPSSASLRLPLSGPAVKRQAAPGSSEGRSVNQMASGHGAILVKWSARLHRSVGPPSRERGGSRARAPPPRGPMLVAGSCAWPPGNAPTPEENGGLYINRLAQGAGLVSFLGHWARSFEQWQCTRIQKRMQNQSLALAPLAAPPNWPRSP